MKLHSPPFEQKLRRAVKRDLKKLPRKRRKRTDRSKQYSGAPLFRAAVSIGVGFAAWVTAERTQHAGAAIAVLGLWGFMFIFIHAQSLWMHLYRATDLAALSLLPISSGEIFRWELQKFGRGSLRSLLDLLLGYGAIAACFHLSIAGWLAAIFAAILTWAVALALAALCAQYFSRAPFQMVVISILVGGGGVFAAEKIFGLSAVLAVLDRVAPTINLLLPTGWPGLLLQIATSHQTWRYAVLLVPIAVILWSVKRSLGQLSAGYDFLEPLLPQASDLVPSEEPPVARTYAEDPARVGPTVVEEIVQSRQFLLAVRWHDRGPFERVLWRWCTPREKRVSEFLFPNGLWITKGWRKTFGKFGRVVLIAFVAGFLSPVLKLTIIILALFVSLCVVLARIAESGRAFNKVLWNSVTVPIYAGFPTSLRELSGVLFKLSMVQFPAILVWSVLCGLLVTHLMELPLADGACYGLRGGVLLVASRFIFIVFSFSSGTNDTAKFRFRTFCLLGAMIGLGGVFLLFAGFGLLLPQPATAWLLTFFAVVEAYLFYRVYGWFYRWGRFDLITLPR